MTGFLFSSLFSTPYFQGAGSTTEAPFIVDCAIGGHGYMIDWSADPALRHVSIPILRQQQDTSESPGEQSINSEGLWRRFGESWHFGAGQERMDRKESNPFRFRASQGVDVWDKWELSLLKETLLLDPDSASDQKLAVAGDTLYYSQADVLKFVTTLSGSATTVTSIPSTIRSMASDGFHVWTAHGTDGVWRTNRGDAASTNHVIGSMESIAYVKNRVMGINEQTIYDITAEAVGAGGPVPTGLFTHGNSDWQWVGFAESQGFIYVAGFSGDKSLIYSITITQDGAALGQPTVAGSLPDGETIASVYGYLGRFLAVGTNKGFRLALVSEGGGLTIGGLITTPAPVLCFEGQDRFIWFGYANFDGITSINASGLGRLSTGEFSDIDNFVPAYASDLMVDNETSQITGIVTYEGRRVFAVDGAGIYTEHEDNYVATAALDSGTISYGITEPKTAFFVDLQVDANETTDTAITVMLSVDGSDFVGIGTFRADNMQTFNAGESVGNEFELRLVFGADMTTPSLAPSILSWLLRSQPRPLVTNLIFVTIILAPAVENLQDGWIDYDTEAELQYLEGINQLKSVVTFQRNRRLYSVVLDDYEVNVKRLVEGTDGMTGINSSATLKLKRI